MAQQYPVRAQGNAIARDAALRACGFDARTSPETLQIVTVLAEQYGLRLELKHLCAIQGRPYITRDGLIHVAHMSGQLDGIEVERWGGDAKQGWWAVVAVYRKDMSRPVRYPGRYCGPNREYGQEMAIKCAECHCLRRAFDVAIASSEERWDVATNAPPAPPAPGPVPGPVPGPAPPAARSQRRNVWDEIAELSREAGIVPDGADPVEVACQRVLQKSADQVSTAEAWQVHSAMRAQAEVAG